MIRIFKFVAKCREMSLFVALSLFVATAASAQPVQAPQYFGATAVNISATGTTAATTATIPAVAGKLAFLCGFSVRSNATAAVTGDITITGMKGGTMTFKHFTAPVASGIGVTEPPLGVCLPASAVSTAIAVVSPAAGTAGLMTVNAWGFYQ